MISGLRPCLGGGGGVLTPGGSETWALDSDLDFSSASDIHLLVEIGRGGSYFSVFYSCLLKGHNIIQTCRD